MIQVVPLGAGQDVGRSCVLISIAGRNIMFDCGMHMGYNDHRRYPDFSYLSKTGDFDSILDCVIISHFHLDHCGALPYFTEICGYSGPIYMTHPTRAIAPILLEDGRKLARGDSKVSATDIRNCMRKVISVDLHQVIQVNESISIKAYYAGHVLGAAMFHLTVKDAFGSESTVVYTGDYNMTPDRHLGSAWIDGCAPDVIITESTYANMIRDSKRARERSFLKKVHDCVLRGGKVLIPVFALGRAQELLILIQSYWERMDGLANKVPVYFSAGLTERANDYYKLFISWTNEMVKKTFVDRNLFDFTQIKTWNPAFAENPGPMVLFTTPGMLHSGTSLDMFKRWCHDPNNMVILPGYCTVGTVGHKVLQGDKKIHHMGREYDVNMSVQNLSFSAHADAKGIMQLIKMSKAKNVILVHGDPRKMQSLKPRIEQELNVRCYSPANGETVSIPSGQLVPVQILKEVYDESLQRQTVSLHEIFDKGESNLMSLEKIRPTNDTNVTGAILLTPTPSTGKKQQPAGGSLSIISLKEASEIHRLRPGVFMYRLKKRFNPYHISAFDEQIGLNSSLIIQKAIELVHASLQKDLPNVPIIKNKDGVIFVGGDGDGTGDIGQILIVPGESWSFLVQWKDQDDDLAIRVISSVHHGLNSKPPLEMNPMKRV